MYAFQYTPVLVFACILIFGHCATNQGNNPLYEVDDDGRIILNFGAIFPMTGKSWAGGQGCKPAVEMALKDVNDRSDILPGYKLKMVWNDSEVLHGDHNRDEHVITLTEQLKSYIMTACMYGNRSPKCNPGLGTNLFYNLLYTPPIKIMMLTGCSAASTPVAEAAHMWNLNVLAWGASSPALSNRERFPTFFRTHPSATLHNPTRIRLCKEWNWTKISVIQEMQEVFTSTSEDLEKEVAKANMTITARASFQTEPKTAVGNLIAQDARIIVGVFYEGFARRIFCEVYNKGFYGPNRVWFLIGWYPDNWYKKTDRNINCTGDNLKEALEGHITTEGMMLKPDDSPSISNMTSERFKERMAAEIKGDESLVTGYPESPLAYDAVWALSLALNNTMNRLAPRNLRLEDYTYNNEEIANEIYMSLNSSNFEGLSGPVAFTSTGDRLAWTQIEQMRDGVYHKIGYYSYSNDNLTMVNTTEEIWPNGIPKDGVETIYQMKHISKSWYISACILASLTIIAAFLCIIFNFRFQHTSYIQCSQCHINSITAMGCIISLVCVFLLGLDGQYVSVTVFPKICHAISWLLSIGFSLGYGSMFSKIVMMHSLVTQEKTDEDGRRKRKKVSVQNVKSWKMYVTIVVILVLNVIFQLVWQVIDPMLRNVVTFPESQTVNDVQTIPQLEHCEADSLPIFLGIGYGVNGLLLIFGLFLAYETRNMSVREINDSRLVGMAIYNVAVLGIITAPVTLIIKDQENAVFGFASLTIIFCSAITLALIFVPKVLEIKQNPRGTYNKSIHGQTTPSREDEQKHSKLSAENEEIKKQLKQREERIRTLTDLIAEHSKTLPKKNNFLQSPPNKQRTNLNGPSNALAPPAISVTEDSAYISMATSSSVIVPPPPKSTNIRRASGISEDELSETYI